MGHALVDQGGKTADKIDAADAGRLIHCLGEGHIAVCTAALCHQGDGRDGDALVDDGDAQLRLDGAAHGHQALGAAADLVIDLLGAAGGVGIGAVPQRHAHGDGSDIELLMVEHIDRLHDFGIGKHEILLTPCAWR